MGGCTTLGRICDVWHVDDKKAAEDMTAEQSKENNISHLPTEVHELLAQLEALSESEPLSTRISLIKQALALISPSRQPETWTSLHLELGDALRELATSSTVTERVEILRDALASYDEALTLSTGKGNSDLWGVIQHNKGVVLSDLADLQEGEERKGTLQEAIACYNKALTISTRKKAPSDWAMTQHNKGVALHNLAGLLMGREQRKVLRAALACFDKALTLSTDEERPDDWAMTQRSKGSALRDLAEVLAGKARFEKLQAALRCYEEALHGYSREESPLEWARTQTDRGIALNDLAELLRGTERAETLRAALASYEDALQIYEEDGRAAGELDWARVLQNKGVVLSDLAPLVEGTERVEVLQESLACYNKALTVFSFEETPDNWAIVQNSKSIALQDLAGSLAGTERVQALRAALACYDDIFLIWQREADPVKWAAGQNNQGTILSDLAMFLMDGEREETLRAAIKHYDHALLVYDSTEMPYDWAMTQYNKGVALSNLAALLKTGAQEEALGSALDCYNQALRIYRRKVMPFDWGMVQQNKADALQRLAMLQTGTKQVETLRAAILCYNKALLERRREVAPISWARTQRSKGDTLSSLTKLLRGTNREKTLQKALLCYEHALTVYTREVLPTEHQQLTQSVGMFLFSEGEWRKAAGYLTQALDTVEDRFAWEVTARGRQTTLETAGDLTAHLAYALVRGDEENAAWRAAQVLERGRVRTTGEATMQQEAQIATARHLRPNLATTFLQVCNRLTLVSLAGTSTSTSPDLEHAGWSAMDAQLASYEEAKAARLAYDEVLTQIREVIPDFLSQSDAIEQAIKELASDERLAYLASTLLGAVIIVVGRPGNADELPTVICWLDERLTSQQIEHLLETPRGEGSVLQRERGGLLAAQFGIGSLRKALHKAMLVLGVSDGTLTRLAAYCQESGVRRLILVPCGLLSLLPLHAALVPASIEGEERVPLIDIMLINYAPSARLWAVCRRRAKTFTAEVPQGLIVSDPQPQEAEMHPLSGAKDEARTIREIILQEAHGQVSTFEGEAATLPRVLEVLKTQRATLTHAHFACHGQTEFSNPYFSGLLLAYGARLTTRDLLDSSMLHFEKLRLAVLSACQTALPGLGLPDEFIGLLSGWLQAGAACVLASLWLVSDSATAAVMGKFYELHLLDRLEPGQAWWLAQRWLRRLPTWREDCRAAGAMRAAEGLEAKEVVHELAVTRGETVLLDDQENRAGIEMDSETMERGISGDGSAADKGGATNQYRGWQDARHWAAFAIYGV